MEIVMDLLLATELISDMFLATELIPYEGEMIKGLFTDQPNRQTGFKISSVYWVLTETIKNEQRR